MIPTKSQQGELKTVSASLVIPVELLLLKIQW